jgi:PAS domain S-box-containing protein
MSQLRPEPANVLLIEDDPHDASLFLERVRHFAPGEFAVTQARTLSAALDEAAEGGYRLAVIDLTLPDSAGIETCSKFNSSNPGIPFIALSGVADDSLRGTLQRSGAIASLVKDDCSGLELIAAMRTACAQTEESRKSAEAARAAAKARLKNAIIDTSDGVVVIDHAGRIILVNSGAEQVLGRATGELIGTELGLDLRPGMPVRAQVVYERDGLARAEADDSNVRQFDVSVLSITDLEFWPFAHTWAGRPVTICALRDVSRQMAEEQRQRDVTKLERPLHIAAGIEEIGTDLAVRLGSLVRFNRFEAALWRPELDRLQVIFELGVESHGREASSLVSRSATPAEFGSWLSERSSEHDDPCVYVSVGHVKNGVYRHRDENILARSASALSAALTRRKASPLMTGAMPVPAMPGVARSLSRLPEAA